jgi:hypothetical protein
MINFRDKYINKTDFFDLFMEKLLNFSNKYSKIASFMGYSLTEHIDKNSIEAFKKRFELILNKTIDYNEFFELYIYTFYIYMQLGDNSESRKINLYNHLKLDEFIKFKDFSI